MAVCLLPVLTKPSFSREYQGRSLAWLNNVDICLLVSQLPKKRYSTNLSSYTRVHRTTDLHFCLKWMIYSGQALLQPNAGDLSKTQSLHPSNLMSSYIQFTRIHPTPWPWAGCDTRLILRRVKLVWILSFF